MKIFCINKLFPIVILSILGAIIHVFLTIKNYNHILTAVPLWMKVTFVIAVWGLLLLLSSIIFCFVSKYFKR